MTCTICGKRAAVEEPLGRGVIVFCCERCLPLVRRVFDHERRVPSTSR